jgi:hypothetical protein
LQEELRTARKQQLADQEALRLQEELLEADPFDPEAQAKIEALIHKRNIEENLAAVRVVFHRYCLVLCACCHACTGSCKIEENVAAVHVFLYLYCRVVNIVRCVYIKRGAQPYGLRSRHW